MSGFLPGRGELAASSSGLLCKDSLREKWSSPAILAGWLKQAAREQLGVYVRKLVMD